MGCTGMTRKNATGIPDALCNIEELNQAMEYGGIIGKVVGKALSFAWQDNNVVLVATTSHSIHKSSDFITVTRKRPGKSPTNAAIARPAFNGMPAAELPIHLAINDYNYGMNAVDLANQLRANYSCQRQFEQRTWRPLALAFFDICRVNSFLIWKQFRSEKELRSKHLHAEFLRTLVGQLLTV